VPPLRAAQPAPPPPRRTSDTRPLRERLRALRIRRGDRLRVALIAVALALISAGAAFALTSAVVGGTDPSSAGGHGSRAWLGVDLTSSAFGGAMVAEVLPGSPAQSIGMEPGDVITQIGGRRILAPSDVTAAIARQHPGEQVQIRYQGSGTSYTARVTLGTRPAGYP
jgi:S1-C subfamily serine protease